MVLRAVLCACAALGLAVAAGTADQADHPNGWETER